MMKMKTGTKNRIDRRHVMLKQGRTTIALERDFWRAVDIQAEAQGIDWQSWAVAQLRRKPGGYGRASWLRVAILRAAING